MYIGFDEHERGRQLDGLEMLIAGYSLAVQHHGLHDDGLESYAGFREYLRSRFGWSMSCGEMAAIRSAASNDAEAWDLFWKLLQEFRESKSS
jgi:hypothetical protein